MLQLDGGRVVSFSFEPIGYRFVSLFPRPWRKRVKSISPSFESKLQRTVSTDLNGTKVAKPCSHTVHTGLSYCYHIVIILLSYCYHIVIILLSYCYHIVIILLSYCYHIVIILLSYCYHIVHITKFRVSVLQTLSQHERGSASRSWPG